MIRHALGSTFVVFALSFALLLAAGCGDSHGHDTEPAAILVVNQSPYFAILSLDDCYTYETPWLEPGESVWIDVDWSVDTGHLPGTLLPCFFFQSFDGSIEGHAAYGPIWVVEGDVQTLVFG